LEPVNHIELSRRAQRDLRRIGTLTGVRVRDALSPNPLPENLDIVGIAGRRPWRRLRLGDHRVLFRPLTEDERLALHAERGWLIARVVDRRDLERAIESLE